MTNATLKEASDKAAARANELAGAMKRTADAMQVGSASIEEFNAAVAAYESAERAAQMAKDKADGRIYD